MSDFKQSSQSSKTSNQEGSLRPIRLNLAEAFLQEGEMALLQGDLKKALSNFDSALELDPKNSKVYFSQALNLFEFASSREENEPLILASKKLKAAAKLDPNNFDTYRVWGSILCLLGLRTQEIPHFHSAKEKLLKALSLVDGQDPSVKAELQWDIGVTFSNLGDHSEEALDWHQAIQAFEEAKELDEELTADFWVDYGHAQLKLATSLGDVRTFVKAVQSFKKAVSIDPLEYDGHHLLAKTMKTLYQHTHDEDHFKEACDSFQFAHEIDPEAIDVLSDWAELLLAVGEKTANPALLKTAAHKCELAAKIDPDDLLIQSMWAEALALCGLQTDNLNLIHRAKRQIEALSEEDEELLSPECLLAEGVCLRSLARYFEEADYEYQAIEKFQEGLSIDRTEHRLWHAMATSYAFLAKDEDSEENIELALRFFRKAIDLHNSTYYLFEYAEALLFASEVFDDEKYIEQAVDTFEILFQRQKNALYLHPEWLIKYGHALDLLGNFRDDAGLYEKAVEIFLHVLTLNPDSSTAHHYLALALSHLGGTTDEHIHYERALHHYRRAMQHTEDDSILIDWAVTLISLALDCPFHMDKDLLFQDAKKKLESAMRQGNTQAYYHLACLYSLTYEFDLSIYYLEKARVADTCPTVEELLEDEWLDDVRATSAFHQFLQELNYLSE